MKILVTLTCTILTFEDWAAAFIRNDFAIDNFLKMSLNELNVYNLDVFNSFNFYSTKKAKSTYQ